MRNDGFLLKTIGIVSLQLCLIGCSLFKNSKNSDLSVLVDKKIQQFHYTDKNGRFSHLSKVDLSSSQNLEDFLAKKKSKINSDPKIFVRRVLEQNVAKSSQEKVLEQSLTLSNPGWIKGEKMVLRPEEAHFSIWFEGKKYTSSLKILKKEKSFELITSNSIGNPSKQNSKKLIPFPKTQRSFCFFSAIATCMKLNGFLSQAILDEKGSEEFVVVWEGYPYFQEAYADVPNELFSSAEFYYDGKIKTKEGDTEHRFVLGLGERKVFYHFNDDAELIKFFWIAEGISMVRKDKVLESSLESLEDDSNFE